MKKAIAEDKSRVIDLLVASFTDDKSVNYIVKQDKFREKRLRALMDYSFEMCYRFGKVYLTDDNNACALVIFPDQKKITLDSIWLDIKLICQTIGITGILKALNRESAIKALQPKVPMFYLWFIGVDPACQHQGIGTTLIRELLGEAMIMNRPVFLETSTVRNLPWYNSFGFEIYHQLDLGYKLFFLKQSTDR